MTGKAVDAFDCIRVPCILARRAAKRIYGACGWVALAFVEEAECFVAHMFPLHAGSFPTTLKNHSFARRLVCLAMLSIEHVPPLDEVEHDHFVLDLIDAEGS